MTTPHSEIAQRVDKNELAKRLLKEHFNGVVLVDPHADEIVPINDSLTGDLASFFDRNNPVYSYNAEQLIQKFISENMRAFIRSKVTLEALAENLCTEEMHNVDLQLKGEDNKILYKRLCYEYYDDTKDIIILTCEDITEMVANETDPLTGLYDSTGFHRRVTAWIQNNPGRKFRIQRYNIDRFRDINGIYGYDIGDRLLREFGQYMKRHDDGECISAHLNADHFVRFCPEGTPPPEYYGDIFRSAPGACKLKLPITIHMGVYDLCEPDCDSFNMSYKALLALQSCKGKYNKPIAYYQKGMMDAEIEQRELLNDVDNALQNDEFEVWFQPQVNYRTKQIVGAEWLTRWRHPQKGLLAPGRFLPIMENSNRIGEMDRYVIEKACRYMRKWMDLWPDKQIILSGNLSRSYVHNPDFVKNLKTHVESNNVPIDNVRFEITESAYMDKPEQLIDVVNQMQKEGFIVEMDDFGSSYSSLNTLKDIDIDILKLDMKFLADESSKRSKIIILSIIRMAKELELPVIAEGVETKEQADMLLDFGCEIMQGYYFSKPVPAEEYEKMLQSPAIFG